MRRMFKSVQAISLAVFSSGLLIGFQTSGGSQGQIIGQPTSGAPKVSAPKFKEGDYFEFTTIGSNGANSRSVRKFKWAKNGFLYFDDGAGREVVYTSDMASVSIGSRNFKPHSGILKFPMTLGSSWSHSYTWSRGVESKDRVRSCSVDAYKMVRVPAGTFPAFVINCTNQWALAMSPAFETYWYAPDAKQIVWYHSDEFGTEFVLTSLNIQ